MCDYAALESRVLSLEGALVASQDRERDTADKLDQALTEVRGTLHAREQLHLCFVHCSYTVRTLLVCL